MLDRIRSWLTSYFDTGEMIYKSSGKQSVDHLKVNIYPSDHLDELKPSYYDMRLNMDDIRAIMPVDSLRGMSPERRLDASLVLVFWL